MNKTKRIIKSFMASEAVDQKYMEDLFKSNVSDIFFDS